MEKNKIYKSQIPQNNSQVDLSNELLKNESFMLNNSTKSS
jgi:hypothetical protein